MAASAALCQVCRLEKPSSNSPMRLAASSATTPTPSAIASGECAALAQQDGGREVVRHPDRLEIGGEEQPARAQHVVAVGKIEVGRGVGRKDLPRAARRGRVARERGQRGQVADRSASQRCWKRAQARSWRSPAWLRPQRGHRCAAGDHGSNASTVPSSGQTPPSAESSALTVGTTGGPARSGAARSASRRARAARSADPPSSSRLASTSAALSTAARPPRPSARAAMSRPAPARSG